MTNNNGCIISEEIDKGEIFKEFSTKFVSTVATSESDRSEVFYSFLSTFLLSVAYNLSFEFPFQKLPL